MTEASSIRIVEMPDLGAVNDASSVVAERSGSGRFGVGALRNYAMQRTITATTRPDPLGDWSTGISSALGGDLSKVGYSCGYTITGAGTLGTPSSGYMTTPELASNFVYLVNQSGHNQSTSTADGRTAAAAYVTRVENQGQGDCMAHLVYGFVNGTKPGATHWLAGAAVSAYVADMYAGAAHVYLNPMEINCTDNGFDCSGITMVANFNRTVSTAALEDSWVCLRGQSIGSASVDAFLSAFGKFTIGLDLTTTVLGTGNCAIALKETQRINFGATNGTGYPQHTNASGPYIVSEAGVLAVANGSNQIQVSPIAVTTLTQTDIGGVLQPLVENATTCGAPGRRWSAVWATNGTIQTSDASLKTDIQPLPAALPLVAAINPITFRWKSDGTLMTKRSTPDADGGWFDIRDAGPGQRTHWGFAAADVKAAIDTTGRDFGGYVRGDDGIENLRPDQLIPVLWKALQETVEMIKSLEARVEGMARTAHP